tara:strand:+ start:422 stop:928 length:507 start_codon:yes stop_codon:yes gene_type:complete
MAPKDKPYSNEIRPVSFGVDYGRRKGSEFFKAKGGVRSKRGAELTAEYLTEGTKKKGPSSSERARYKKIRAGAKVPLGIGDTRLTGDIGRSSYKGSYQDEFGSGNFKDKQKFDFGVGFEKPLFGGTASVRAARERIGKKERDDSIMLRYSKKFNKGGKVKKRSKRKKK